MADDSVSQTSDQNTASPPAPPSDSTTPPVDIGQQSASAWPNSTNLANTPNPADSSPSDLANDQPIAPVSPPPVSTEEKSPEPPAGPEPPKEDSISQTTPSEVGQSVSSDSTWPDSTKMANPVSTISADSPTVPVEAIPDSSQPTTSSASEAGDLSSPSPVLPVETSSPQVGLEPSNATDSSYLNNPSNINNPPPVSVSLPDQQAPQVHSDPPNDASSVATEKTPDQLASFKPESPEQPQEAPLANTDSQDSSQKSFGDLLSGNTNRPTSSPSASPSPDLSNVSNPSDLSSQPVVPSSSPTTSFGDLIKDIEITPPSIPEAVRPVEQSSQNQQSPPPQPPQSPPPSTFSQTDELSFRRQKANQVRSQKKKDHLDKIMELAKNTKSISNTDVQRLLRVSQSTATNYLSELSKKRLLKKQGIRGGAKYTL